MIFILLTLLITLIVNIGCISFGGKTSSTQTNESSISTSEVVIGTHLSLGVNLYYSSATVNELNTRYSFSGNVYFIFELDFLESVSMSFETATIYDEATTQDVEYILKDRVTISSENFNDESLYDYLVSYLSSNYTKTTYGSNITGTTYYRDNDGNILKMVYISDNEIYLRVSQHCGVFFDPKDGAWFIFPLGMVAIDIESSKELLVYGCPSCLVSDIVDGEYTYTYMGYSFEISQNDAIVIDGNYHFNISHVSDE